MVRQTLKQTELLKEKSIILKQKLNEQIKQQINQN